MGFPISFDELYPDDESPVCCDELAQNLRNVDLEGPDFTTLLVCFAIFNITKILSFWFWISQNVDKSRGTAY